MRKISSTPKDRAFYNEHGGSLTAYQTIANLGQLLSAASLALAVFTLLSDAIAGRGLSVTSTAVTIAAVLIGAFIELANRMLARPSIRPLVLKDQFTDNDEKRRRHQLVTRFSRCGLLVVGLLSFGLSYMGSMDAGQLITQAPPPPALDSLRNAFTADTAALLAPFTIRRTAALEQFNATEANRTKAAQDFSSCARRGNGWCKKKQRAILAEIDAARAAYNATAATIAIERGKAIAAALERRNSDRDTEIATATAAATEATAKAASNGYIFAILTFAGQLVFYLMLYLILQIEAGSEIGKELQPNEFHYQPSVLADLRAVISHRVERGARRLIRWAFGDRERLKDSLPYVQVWDAPPPLTDDPPALASAAIDAPHAPGFYRAADDPHTKGTAPDSRALYSTPTAHGHTSTHTATTHTKAAHETPESREAKQRLKQYKKRLGEHTQKAKVQQRKTGTVSSRTAKAIKNNRLWVDHYTEVLNSLER